jgi:hypothetical protein
MKRHPTPLRLAVERIFVGAALCTILALTFGGHASHAQSAKKKAMQVSAIDDIPFKPTVDTYTVQQGDTLWSISRKYTGSPWLWPRVWSYNPEINNPNWIYPGDTIRFYPSDVELPSMYDLANADRQVPQTPTEPAEIAPPSSVDTSRYAGIFVTPKELAEAGTLRNSTDEHILFTRNDRVIVSFPSDAQPRSGERYFVYRTVGKVTHPITNKPYGYMTEVTGLASIEEVYDKSSKAKIEHTRLEVERGQYVSKYDEHAGDKVKATKAPDNMEAYILAVNSDHGVVAGKAGVVFIDKGSNDGVQKGNQFSVLKTDDLISKTDNLPPKIVATLMVIDAKETASTCLVTMSKQEIEPGLKVKAR